MSIDKVTVPPVGGPGQQKQDYPLIASEDIKAILYMGIRGEISLPIEEHDVDIMV